MLVPRTRRLRSTRFVQVTRAAVLPRPQQPARGAAGPGGAGTRRRGGLARGRLNGAPDPDGGGARGHCEPASVVRELNEAKLLGRAHVVDAVDALLVEGRAMAEGRLYEMVRTHRLPQPLWNVELSLPGGSFLGGVDAYWPEQAVALELGARSPREEHVAYAAEREHLERLGVTVVRVTPKQLRDSTAQLSVVLRTAMMAAEDREPHGVRGGHAAVSGAMAALADLRHVALSSPPTLHKPLSFTKG